MPFERINAAMAQLVERVLGKDEVTGSIPVSSSKKKEVNRFGVYLFLCRLIRVGDFGLTKDNQKGSRKRNNGRDVFGGMFVLPLTIPVNSLQSS